MAIRNLIARGILNRTGTDRLGNPVFQIVYGSIERDPRYLAELSRPWYEPRPPGPNARLSESVWNRLRAAVFLRDGHACRYCGSGENLACDHVVPKSRGGGDELENLATACRSCNSSKGGRTPEEWLGRRTEATT